MPLDPVAPSPPARAGLVDALDHLINRGAVLTGDATLSVAGVDLVYVGLNLLIASAETLHKQSRPAEAMRFETRPSPEPLAPTALVTAPLDPWRLAAPRPEPIEQPAAASLPEIAEPPDTQGAERSLAQLVLTLVELLRQLVERQALRRLEGNSLTEDQIERMGRALLELSEKMAELRAIFGLEEADLRLDLGPLGRLL